MSGEIIRPRIFEQWNFVRAGMSTRRGNDRREAFGMNLSYRVGDDPAAVEKNRKWFFDALGIDPNDAAIPEQVHSADARYASRGGEYQHCDALFTSQQHVALVVTVADCVPILLLDTRRRIIAAVHAGWRGSAARILATTIAELRNRFGSDSADVAAWMGPSAGPCCYEVGAEVAQQFSSEIAVSRQGKWYLDLKAANERQLKDEGVLERRIERSNDCTICNVAFHSYRRDGERSGRMMAAIMMLT